MVDIRQRVVLQCMTTAYFILVPKFSFYVYQVENMIIVEGIANNGTFKVDSKQEVK